jgi:hypothetical protein
MKIAELELELEGISGTITRYTQNPYIVGYLNVLKKYVEQSNIEMIKMCLMKIIDWYKVNYDKIMSNQYVFNKQEHTDTRNLLNKILKELS